MPRSKVCSLQILIVINSQGEKGCSGDVLPGEGLFWDAPPGQITYHFRPEKNGKQKPHHETTVESLKRPRIFKYTKRSCLFKRKLWASLFLSQLASKKPVFLSEKARVYFIFGLLQLCPIVNLSVGEQMLLDIHSFKSTTFPLLLPSISCNRNRLLAIEPLTVSVLLSLQFFSSL